MSLERVIDDFVTKINALPRPPLPQDDVPEKLRSGDRGNAFYDWRIAKDDHLHRIGPLQEKLPAELPPSYRYFISNYSFPAFSVGGVVLFANTGERIYWELGERMFGDSSLTSVLFHAGLIPFAAPDFSDYDPVCFDTGVRANEYPIVQIDQEAALGLRQVVVVRRVAPTFLDLLRRVS